MVGYVRKDTANNIADGNVVNASDLDNEFDGVVAAFNASTGHAHGGGTGEGSPILTMGPTQDVTVSATLMAPKTTNTVDIGSTALKFKDLYMAGNASVGGTLNVTGVATFGNGAVLGTPASGTVTNLTGTASININGTVGATTASTGAFTTLSASSTVSGTGFSTYLASPPAIGGTAAAAVSATTLTTSSTVTHNGGTANGVAYLNGSKVLTTGSALTFDGTVLLSGAGGTGTSNSILKLSGSNANSYGSYLQFLRNNVPTWSIGNDSAINGGSSDDLTIYGTASQRFYASGSEQMRLTSTGLGIGTSSPAYKLDVNGQARLGGSSGLVFGVGTAFAGGQAEVYSVSTTPMGLGTTGAAALRLYTNSTLQATLDSAGNLGLGVTPSAWGSGQKALDVNGAALMGAGTNGYLSANAYFNTGWKYKTAAVAALYSQEDAVHKWYYSASGTAGNAITFTQAATLDASGNYMVGTTSSAGVLSNEKKVVGGSFTTRQATTASLVNGATEDITGLLSGATYMVVCRGDVNTTTFVVHTAYVNAAGGVTLATLSTGNGFVLTSPSNNTLRVTGLVSTQTYTYSLTRIF